MDVEKIWQVVRESDVVIFSVKPQVGIFSIESQSNSKNEKKNYLRST